MGSWNICPSFSPCWWWWWGVVVVRWLVVVVGWLVAGGWGGVGWVGCATAAGLARHGTRRAALPLTGSWLHQ